MKENGSCFLAQTFWCTERLCLLLFSLPQREKLSLRTACCQQACHLTQHPRQVSWLFVLGFTMLHVAQLSSYIGLTLCQSKLFIVLLNEKVRSHPLNDYSFCPVRSEMACDRGRKPCLSSIKSGGHVGKVLSYSPCSETALRLCLTSALPWQAICLQVVSKSVLT